MASVTGTAGNDNLSGTSSNDNIYSYDGNDTLTGGAGNDNLYGGNGNDTYVFGSGFGQDYIFDSEGRDIIEFSTLISTDIEFEAKYSGSSSRTDLIIKVIGATDSIRIQNFFDGENPSTTYAVEKFVFQDGSEILASEVFALLPNPILGTENADALNGSNFDDNIQGLGGNDNINSYAGNDSIAGGDGRDNITSVDGINTIDGGAGNDYVYTYNGTDSVLGGSGNDYISTGNADDTIEGGLNNDSLYGGNGNDTYIFNTGFGHDFLSDPGDTDVIQLNGLSSTDVEFEALYNGYSNRTDLLVKVKGTDDSIRIQHFFADESPSSTYGIERFVFPDSSDEVLASEIFDLLPDTITGTENTDLIHTSNFDDNIQGLGGNDNINSYAGNDSISAGDGRDIITSVDGINTIDGGAGNDYVYTYNGTDSVLGGSGNDYITTGNADDTLEGGADKDSLYGGNGNDTYVFNADFGQDLINDSGATDTIQFNGLSSSDIEFEALYSGYTTRTDLLVKVKGADDSIRIQHFFDGENPSSTYGIERFVFPDSSDEVLASEVFALLPDIITGTENADTLKGSNFDDNIQALGGNDNIQSYAGNDSINGGAGNDYVYTYNGTDSVLGGAGNDYITTGNADDTLEGGADKDSLYGGNGNDTYIFNAGFGQDIISDSADTDIIQFNHLLSSDIKFEPLHSGYSTRTDLMVKVIGSTDSIRIQHFFDGENPSSIYGIEKFVFKDGSEILASEVFALLPNPIVGTNDFDSLYGSNFDETIQALDGNDYVYAYDGDNSIEGGNGNDYISAQDGNDTINGGNGRDSIYAGHGNNQVDGGADNDYIYTYNGQDYVNGGTGNDYITTGNADDTLAGGNGNDSLYGGNGNDTYVFNTGFGQDYLYDGAGNDIVKFENLMSSDVKFNAGYNGNHTLTDLIVSVKGTSDNIKIQYFFDGENPSTKYGIEKFVFQDGSEILGTEVFGLLPNPIVGTENNDTIYSSNFNDNIQALAGDDYVYSYGGNDTIEAGAGNDYIQTGNGNKTVIAGLGSDRVYTYNGADSVLGGANNDYISTGIADDTLTGGADRDSLYGGAGNDTYLYNAGDGQDIIQDTTGNDTIIFGAGILESQTTFTTNGNQLDITFNGNGNSDKITIQYHNHSDTYKIENFVFTSPITEDTILGAASNDTLTGNSLNQLFIGFDGNDQIFAKGGNDILVGGAGHDLLSGGTGMDTMNGGIGNDSYYVDNVGDVVSDTDGYDSVRSIIDYTLSDNLEKLILQGTAITGVGNDLSNKLLGNSENNTIIGHGGDDYLAGFSGNDSLLGGTGNDNIDGGKGIDTMIGGAGNDRYVVDNTGDVIFDTEGKEFVTAYADYTLSANLEHLQMRGSAVNGAGNDLNNIIGGTSLDNILLGKSGNDQLFGKTGNDNLVGGAGNDLLSGGSGMDTMNGGIGNDSYYVDNTGDVVTDTDGYDSVRSKIDYTLSDNLEKLILQGTAITGVGNDLSNKLLGNSENNTIIGHGGDDYLAGFSGNDSLLGGTGNDNIDGGKGIDTMIGGAGNDRYIVDNTGDVIFDTEGKDFVTTYVDYTLSANLEHLQMTGSAINGTGNDLNNIIGGTSLDNFLSGKNGDDQLFGKAGNDTVDGGSGNDYLAAGLNDDLYLFKAGDGDDFINDTGSDSGDTIRFASDIDQEDIAFFKRGTSLDIKYGAGDLVTVYKYDNPANTVENIEHLTGTSADVEGIINHIVAYEAANSVNFSNVDQVSNDVQLMSELQVYWT